jgi:hypothetical protein
VPPVTCLDIFRLESNMQRWLSTIIIAVIGLVLGLVYGLIIDPVEIVDTTPDTLRADFRADYILMAAEAYQVEGDPALAARRLGVLSSQAPGDVAAEGVELARQFGFADTDTELIQKLSTALQAWQPVSGSSPP